MPNRDRQVALWGLAVPARKGKRKKLLGKTVGMGCDGRVPWQATRTGGVGGSNRGISDATVGGEKKVPE